MFYLFLACFFLLSCEAFQGGPVPVGNSGYPPWPGPLPGNPPPFSPEDGSKAPGTDPKVTNWGVIKCDESQLEVFNVALRKFLHSTMNPTTVPRVNCSKRTDLKGGIWIRGKVYFENNATFDPQSSSQNLNVSTSSRLEIHIVGVNNKQIPTIVMRAEPYAGAVHGQYATLVFSNKKGQVTLDGTIENGVFSGTIGYENFTTWKGGSTGYKGQMGFFSIYACSLFSCGSSPTQNTRQPVKPLP